jgi:hypothetical protein
VTLSVGAGAVHLVDEREAGDVVALHLTVDRDRLRLDAADGTEHQDRAVEDAERALHFDGEVDVAGGVDQVDELVLPLQAGGGRLDRDARSFSRSMKSMVAPTPPLPRTSSILWMRPA